jgi:PAS domain S-box-containing protein
MFTMLPAFKWRVVLSSIAGSALTSCIFIGAVLCLGALGELFHNVRTPQALVFLISLPGLALVLTAQAASPREESVGRGEELYRVLIDSTNDGIWIIDGDHRTTAVNRRMAEMLGYMSEEIQGHPLVEFMFPEDVSEKPPEYLRHSHFKRVVGNRFRRKDGSELWAQVSARPLATKSGEVAEVMIIVSDATLLREMEDTLRRNEKLITASRLAATISHEINGPLEAVVNTFRLWREEAMTEQGRHYLRLAEKEIQKISAITKRTLGLFRDSSSWEELSLCDLLDDTISFCRNRLVAHSIRVMNDYHSRGIARVSRGGVQQVFANLISNALDAMTTGGTLTVRVIDVTRNQAAGIRVEVEDTGRGIADVDLKRIFDPFFTTKQNGGTGLGLWVVKEIIEKHGGTITVTSRTQPGEKCGTLFSILLPQSAAQVVA